ncbi:rhomboid family intramembrane serine protease [Cyanobacterium aponinum]|uniref:Rhomboid family intramembrane serine protease n=1 Tax=Cyanobacterium aponinum AL20115 TaxID=3090662 RepID=A0AAF1C0E3_9CHRO|nr:rhomboid family intramembrane serine protease [Cyanobacterium aponinum]WPF87502.1 rhomboid family intramembrane serine protease [Cyanobacterium aponinum AL20115]
MMFSRILFRQAQVLLIIIILFIILCFVNVETNKSLNLLLGIHPRNYWSLIVGIPCSWLVHNSWSHLWKNLIPFIMFGMIACSKTNIIRLISFCIIVGGIGTWLFSPDNTVTVGSSVVIYGFYGWTLFFGLIHRNILWFLISIITIYYTNHYLYGLFTLNNSNPAWLVHLFGFIGGFLGSSGGRMDE